METYSLTDGQRELARKLHKQVGEGKITSPSEFLDGWTSRHLIPDVNPESDIVPYPERTEFIDPSKIAGTTKTNVNRFNRGRIQTHLARFHNGEFRREVPAPPRLQKIEDKYYVTSDGLHRSMVAKALDLEEIYAVYSIPPNSILVPPEDC
ncbi:hypothetical protein KVP04_00425 [Halobacterium salinarum]|uniref:hypothetical protein n=1 Tax=Halobacterium salinarum TaxID=2242 RepID=UPI001F317722|nr:hypothetical protein [Halobacterium salinarum]MCF2165401.1 hypothetical protein [Halobacterium salinarum]MCF2168212.1 hypothetical protein [Halobacterium salinarum]MCF2237601.1 hypothetical protein [Halobacterium salinarum]